MITVNNNTNKVEYTLEYGDLKPVIITEPIGWNEDEKEYSRNKKYHGIIAKFSNSLKFIKDGYDFVKYVYDFYGINADIKLTKKVRHPNTDEMEISYTGFIDLSTYSEEKKQISVKFNASGLEKLIKSRESEKVEIERLDTIDGVEILELETKTVALDGRRIFLKSQWEVDDINNSINIYTEGFNDNTRGSLVGIPSTLSSKSHTSAESVLPNISVTDNSALRDADGTTGICFFLNSDKTRTFRLKIKLSFKINILENVNNQNVDFWVKLTNYKNGSNFNFNGSEDLMHYDLDDNTLNNQTLYVDFDQDVTVEKFESLSLQFSKSIKGIDGTTNSPRFHLKLSDIECIHFIEEDSFFEKSSAKTILAHELGQRLSQIITGRQDAFYSEELGRVDNGYAIDGPSSMIGFTHGHWVRGFDKIPLPQEETSTSAEVINKYKAFTTSFKEFTESLGVLGGLGLGIEKIGGKERVVMEKAKYFFNNNVTIRLPNQVTNLKRSVAKDYYFSGLEIGFEKGGEYEEAMGLDEYNAKSTFTTVINRLNKVFKKTSKYRADSYGLEFARRKPRTENDTEDTNYDKNIFALDLKKVTNDLYHQRVWQDDFEQAPTGTFSPDTATNLRFSPFNLMLKHAWYFGAGFTKYLTDYVRYGSSTANSGLKTKLIDGVEYAENGNIINSNLEKPRFIPEWLEFEYKVDYNLMKQIEGTTIIKGKKIPNFYGLVEFNYKGKIEKGFLFSVKPNGNGTFKLLKSSRNDI